MLRSLGLTPGQTRRATAWQAVSIAAVAVAVGAPIGILIGSWAWLRYAASLDVLPESAVPWSTLAVVVPAALVIAAIAAIGPGHLSARRRPAEILRAE